MAPEGFEEMQAKYALADDPRMLIGQIRNLGDAGPAYEIMDIDSDGNVVVEIIYSDERLTFPLAEILEDPFAETIP